MNLVLVKKNAIFAPFLLSKSIEKMTPSFPVAKKLVKLFAIILYFNILTVSAQNDSIFFLKNGVVTAKFDIQTEVDSILFHRPIFLECDYFVDTRDSTIYHKVTIGTQVWMSENLRYLPSVVGSDSMSECTNVYYENRPYYYVYGYEGTSVVEAKATANYNTYGVLYNWPAAMGGDSSSTANPSGVQGACPNGWHLPSYDEWTQLIEFCGGDTVAGGKLKEVGTTHWLSPNVGATDEFGFTGLPQGGFGGNFANMNYHTVFWSTTSNSIRGAKTSELGFGHQKVYRFNYVKNNGLSVRCIRN